MNNGVNQVGRNWQLPVATLLPNHYPKIKATMKEMTTIAVTTAVTTTKATTEPRSQNGTFTSGVTSAVDPSLSDPSLSDPLLSDPSFSVLEWGTSGGPEEGPASWFCFVSNPYNWDSSGDVIVVAFDNQLFNAFLVPNGSFPILLPGRCWRLALVFPELGFTIMVLEESKQCDAPEVVVTMNLPFLFSTALGSIPRSTGSPRATCWIRGSPLSPGLRVAYENCDKTGSGQSFNV